MRDVYIAIMRAAARGQGLHLTADEVFGLSLDDAVETRASNTLERGEWEKVHAKPGISGWCYIAVDRTGKVAENIKSGEHYGPGGRMRTLAVEAVTDPRPDRDK